MAAISLSSPAQTTDPMPQLSLEATLYPLAPEILSVHQEWRACSHRRSELHIGSLESDPSPGRMKTLENRTSRIARHLTKICLAEPIIPS